MLQLIHKIAAAEKSVRDSVILAPRPLGGLVRVRVDGLICQLASTPRDFEGWGLFSAEGPKTARLRSQASLAQRQSYLERLPQVRMVLVGPGQGKSWTALPANSEVAARRFRLNGPRTLHLVERGRAFETVIARYDGANLWFDRTDRQDDPKMAAALARELRAFTSPENVRVPGLTPEQRQAYQMVHAPEPSQAVARCSEERLRRALQQGGGTLQSFVDCGDTWTTQWSTPSGELHVSAIAKTDLTVISAGICLDGEDQKFDLATLVGVVERQGEEW